ncbi:MAG: Nif3-like dinuclear metal center hexameric protein [Metamycoplasmataceae bacterium]
MIINNEEDLISLIEKKFPLTSAEQWDFSGFSYKSKRPKNDVKILLCLDVTEEIVLTAIKEDYSIIISHHPFIFASNEEEYFKKFPHQKHLFDLIQENNISLYAIHTNFDNHPKGTAMNILKRIGIGEEKIKEQINSAAIFIFDGKIKKISQMIKKSFSFSYLETNCPKNKKISQIAIFPGSGDLNEIIHLASEKEIDLFITSDLKWNEKIELDNKDINYLIVSHKIEEVFIDAMKQFFFENKIKNTIKKYHIRNKMRHI